MPRQARLDAPDTLHHVMVRGLERRAIFRDDTDRAEFLTRLADVVEHGALTLYASALLPNHAHLLVRTGTRPLPRSMRSLLTGYAGAFNRRHRRVGHLFQNRYKSIVVEAGPYLLELIQYLHLNPLRAKIVPDLRRLDRFRWTGHSALVNIPPGRQGEGTDGLGHGTGATPRGSQHVPRRLSRIAARTPGSIWALLLCPRCLRGTREMFGSDRGTLGGETGNTGCVRSRRLGAGGPEGVWGGW